MTFLTVMGVLALLLIVLSPLTNALEHDQDYSHLDDGKEPLP